MGFKMKGINSLNNNSLNTQVKQSHSPLFSKSFAEINEEIEITNSVKDLKGDDFATERTITKKGQEVEKQLVPEDFEGGENNPEYQKKLAALKIAMEQGKGDKYKDQKIDQVRDYNVEKKSEYKIDKDTGKSYILEPIKGSKVKRRVYHYPGYNTGHHAKGVLVSENEMLGNLYETYPTKTYGKKAQKIYATWLKKNTGRDVSWGSGSYSRNNKTNNSESENKGDWKNNN